MKHSVTAVLLAGALAGTVMLAGCGSQAAASTATGAAESTVTEAVAAPTAAPSEQAAVAQGSLPVSLTGVVSEAMMHGFTLTMDDGTSVRVSTDDNTQNSLADGLLDGITVQVGGTQDADGNVTALSVSSVAEPAELLFLTGTVENASMNQFTLVLEDGTKEEVLLGDNTVKTLANGLGEGNSVSVGGSRQSDGTVLASALMDAAANAPANVTPQAPEGWASVTGTVSDAMMSSFNLKTDDGKTIEVVTTDTTINVVTDGFGDGLKVTVSGVQDGDVLTASHIAPAA